jgi:hypothetical protein
LFTPEFVRKVSAAPWRKTEQNRAHLGQGKASGLWLWRFTMLSVEIRYQKASCLRAHTWKDIGGRGAKDSRDCSINEPQRKRFATEMQRAYDRRHAEERKRYGQLSAITREQWTDLLEHNCIENGPFADLLCRISSCTFPDKMLLFRRYGLGETFAQVGATIQCKSKPQRLGISQERVRQLTAKACWRIFRDESMESRVDSIFLSAQEGIIPL